MIVFIFIFASGCLHENSKLKSKVVIFPKKKGGGVKVLFHCCLDGEREGEK